MGSAADCPPSLWSLSLLGNLKHPSGSRTECSMRGCMKMVRLHAGQEFRAIEMVNIVEYRLKLFVGLAGLEGMRADHACPPVGFYSSAKACGCMVDEIEVGR